jgi:hypothetical protein
MFLLLHSRIGRGHSTQRKFDDRAGKFDNLTAIIGRMLCGFGAGSKSSPQLTQVVRRASRQPAGTRNATLHLGCSAGLA